MGKRGHLAVVGAGSWGTAFATVLARNHLPTLLWARRPELAREINTRHANESYLPGCALPTTLRATADLEEAVGRASVVVVAVPSHALREKMKEMGPLISPDASVVSLTKGVEQESLLRMTEVISEAGNVDPERTGAVSGPNLAKEVARDLPGATVIACADDARAERLQRLFHCAVLPRLHQHRRVRGRDRRRGEERRRDRGGDRRRARATATTPRPRSSRAGWSRSRAWR